MIEVKHCGSGEHVRTYVCTPKREIELCLANIECLLNIALLDSDKHIKELGGEQELLNLMDRYIDLAYRLSGMTVESNWIPVSKRLPKESGKYLVTHGGTYLIGIDFYSTEEDAKRIFEEPEEYSGWRSNNVIAWMPSPEPYEAESEEEE